jgi:hypothetical protein
MGEQSAEAWQTPWSQMSQIRLEIESEIRNKISSEISAYSAVALERGISNYFISGLDVAANIAIFGTPQKEKLQEDKENE